MLSLNERQDGLEQSVVFSDASASAEISAMRARGTPDQRNPYATVGHEVAALFVEDQFVLFLRLSIIMSGDADAARELYLIFADKIYAYFEVGTELARYMMDGHWHLAPTVGVAVVRRRLEADVARLKKKFASAPAA